MKRLDLDSSVIQWSSEEVVIPYLYSIDNRVHRYFADFWVKRKEPDGSISETLVEIKPKAQTKAPKEPKRKTRGYVSSVLTWQKNQDKWKAAKKYAEQRGMDFIILTEEELFGKKVK